MPYFYGFDWSYIVYVLPALILAMWAQHNVNSTFKKYSRVPSMMTGADAARLVLQGYGIGNVGIGRVNGQLTDHYDPRSNSISLSETVYDVRTAAAVGVAAHEAGHAAQYAENYGPIKLRAAIIPITNIGSNLAMPLILLGLAMSFESLAYLGVLCFGVSVVFQLITLPVEFDASRRAVKALSDSGMMSDEGLSAAKQVLTAAALTYVAALAVAIGNLLRLLTLVNRRRD
ncbi:MAG: zinc metallopeptidase [Clostridia bacterium]|jgi:Zn-dependent membrane protease YugP|nr:zinc metallopeptidase [Clostridia bacterium]